MAVTRNVPGCQSCDCTPTPCGLPSTLYVWFDHSTGGDAVYEDGPHPVTYDPVYDAWLYTVIYPITNPTETEGELFACLQQAVFGQVGSYYRLACVNRGDTDTTVHVVGGTYLCCRGQASPFRKKIKDFITPNWVGTGTGCILSPLISLPGFSCNASPPDADRFGYGAIAGSATHPTSGNLLLAGVGLGNTSLAHTPWIPFCKWTRTTSP